MKILIIQEAGRHEKNKNFRECLNFQRALSKINGIECKVWGLNQPDWSNSFFDMESWADVIFIIENYMVSWLPINEIFNSKKLKIFWSIDSHYSNSILEMHKHICKALKINILLNSTESYIPEFKGCVDKSYWFPNAYPDDLIYPLNLEKTIDIGFCGNDRPEIHYLDKYNIQKDIFVIGGDMVKAINSYKIHFNKNIANDINYRTFETTGCKTFLLTNYTPGLEKLFDIGKEIVIYDSIEDLDNKIEYYLKNEANREEIAKRGYDKSKKYHTYSKRAEMLLEIIKNY